MKSGHLFAATALFLLAACQGEAQDNAPEPTPEATATASAASLDPAELDAILANLANRGDNPDASKAIMAFVKEADLQAKIDVIDGRRTIDFETAPKGDVSAQIKCRPRRCKVTIHCPGPGLLGGDACDPYVVDCADFDPGDCQP